MANERLRQALLTAGVSTDELAQRVGTDSKTVERWISTDRVPHRRNRASAADALGVDESILWPQTADARARAVVDSEVLHVFPDRGSVPPSSWYELLERAREHVDVLVFAGLFLSDSRADLPALVARQARDGVRVRLLLGDPASDAVARRGAEEDIGDALAARIRMSLSYIAPAFEIPGVSVRLHETTLYNSLYRFDDDLLVNMHSYGAVASKSPVMHVRRIEGGRLFPHYMESFEKVWTAAKPLANQALARMNGTPH
jgi:transcriptional regulator with XRE-family HTH domain